MDSETQWMLHDAEMREAARCTREIEALEAERSRHLERARDHEDLYDRLVDQDLGRTAVRGCPDIKGRDL
jgi:hypothetical protein